MFRYLVASWALVACVGVEGALAAQQIEVRDAQEASALAAAEQRAAAAVTKPARPTGLNARAVSTTEILLTWSDNAADEAEYRLEVSSLDQPWELLGVVPPNTTSIYVFALDPGTTYLFRVRASNNVGLSLYSNEAAGTAWFRPGELGDCVAGGGMLCLHGGRYRVEASFQTAATARGGARAVGLTNDSGYFWFFDAANIEVVVKLVDGCAVNKRHWVFATGLTNVRVVVLVTDLQTGATATYLNERDRAFVPVQDTSAFPSCG